MTQTKDCFLKVKNDYLKFLRNEKIFNQSKETKIENLKKTYIPTSFWIEKKYQELFTVQVVDKLKYYIF